MGERKPSDDLKEGLSLLFRAARGAAKQVEGRIDAKSVEKTVSDGAKEMVRVVTSVGKALGHEIEKVVGDEEEKKSPEDKPPPKVTGGREAAGP